MAKMAIFGCFRTNMGLFLIEYEGSVPETCTKSLGILGSFLASGWFLLGMERHGKVCWHRLVGPAWLA